MPSIGATRPAIGHCRWHPASCSSNHFQSEAPAAVSCVAPKARQQKHLGEAGARKQVGPSLSEATGPEVALRTPRPRRAIQPFAKNRPLRRRLMPLGANSTSNLGSGPCRRATKPQDFRKAPQKAGHGVASNHPRGASCGHSQPRPVPIFDQEQSSAITINSWHQCRTAQKAIFHQSEQTTPSAEPGQ